MNGLDQIIVALWFLPVVLFILIPLTVTCLWVVLSPILALFIPVAGQSKQKKPVKAAATT